MKYNKNELNKRIEVFAVAHVQIIYVGQSQWPGPLGLGPEASLPSQQDMVALALS